MSGPKLAFVIILGTGLSFVKKSGLELKFVKMFGLCQNIRPNWLIGQYISRKLSFVKMSGDFIWLWLVICKNSPLSYDLEKYNSWVAKFYSSLIGKVWCQVYPSLGSKSLTALSASTTNGRIRFKLFKRFYPLRAVINSKRDIKMFNLIANYTKWQVQNSTCSNFLNRPYPVSFSVIFGLLKPTVNFLTTNQCKNVHPVSGAGIRTHDLKFQLCGHLNSFLSSRWQVGNHQNNNFDYLY